MADSEGGRGPIANESAIARRLIPMVQQRRTIRDSQDLTCWVAEDEHPFTPHEIRLRRSIFMA